MVVGRVLHRRRPTGSGTHCVWTEYNTEECSVERRRKMLLTLLLTALAATSGEDTNTMCSEGEGHLLRGRCVPLPFRSSWQWQSGRGG